VFFNSRLEMFLIVLLLCASAVAGQENGASADTSGDRSYYANAHPYLDFGGPWFTLAVSGASRGRPKAKCFRADLSPAPKEMRQQSGNTRSIRGR
jgi:hypothetical protein